MGNKRENIIIKEKSNSNRTHIPVEGYKVEDLQSKTLEELVEIALKVRVENPNEFKRKDLIFEILKSQVKQGRLYPITGIIWEGLIGNWIGVNWAFLKERLERNCGKLFNQKFHSKIWTHH